MGVRWKHSVISHGIRSTSVSVGSEGRHDRLAKGLDLDLNALGDLQGMTLVGVDVDSHGEKPWRKPGADISDYFNYGFNEDTWKAYCGKRRRLRGNWQNSHSHCDIQRGHTDTAHKAPRKWCGAIDVIGGRTAALGRQEGRRRNRGDAIQQKALLSSAISSFSSISSRTFLLL
ncbi:unnamed protein product [Merluccius merluccius]